MSDILSLRLNKTDVYILHCLTFFVKWFFGDFIHNPFMFQGCMKTAVADRADSIRFIKLFPLVGWDKSTQGAFMAPLVDMNFLMGVVRRIFAFAAQITGRAYGPPPSVS